MKLTIDTPAEFGKSLSVKREKAKDDEEPIVCKAAFSDAFVTRDVFDRLCGQVPSWCDAFYDDLGAPLLKCELALPEADWSAVAAFKAGNARGASLAVPEGRLEKIVLRPVENGALLSAVLGWVAAGDEVEDVSQLLGALVNMTLHLDDGGQADLFKQVA